MKQTSDKLELRTEVLSLKLKAREKEVLAERARASGLTVSTFVHQWLTSGRPPRARKKYYTTLAKVHFYSRALALLEHYQVEFETAFLRQKISVQEYAQIVDRLSLIAWILHVEAIK